MEDAKALLDSLMGQTRNAGKEERKKKKMGESFKEDSVCKFFLIGFCPEHESLFNNTKRDIGECPQTHFEINLDEFKAHPDKERYQIDYEKQLIPHLKSLIRQCDDWGAKERLKNERKVQEDGGNDVACAQIKKLCEQSSSLLAEAEEFASAGNFAVSKGKVAEAEQIKKTVEEWRAKEYAPAEVCEVCGLSKEYDGGNVYDKVNNFSHARGKVHSGFERIRTWYADLLEKHAQLDLDKRERDRSSKDGDGHEKRDRDKSSKDDGDDHEKRERDKSSKDDDGQDDRQSKDQSDKQSKGDSGSRVEPREDRYPRQRETQRSTGRESKSDRYSERSRGKADRGRDDSQQAGRRRGDDYDGRDRGRKDDYIDGGRGRRRYEHDDGGQNDGRNKRRRDDDYDDYDRSRGRRRP